MQAVTSDLQAAGSEPSVCVFLPPREPLCCRENCSCGISQTGSTRVSAMLQLRRPILQVLLNFTDVTRWFSGSSWDVQSFCERFRGAGCPATPGKGQPPHSVLAVTTLSQWPPAQPG